MLEIERGKEKEKGEGRTERRKKGMEGKQKEGRERSGVEEECEERTEEGRIPGRFIQGPEMAILSARCSSFRRGEPSARRTPLVLIVTRHTDDGA